MSELRTLPASKNPPPTTISRNDGGRVFRRLPKAGNGFWAGFEADPANGEPLLQGVNRPGVTPAYPDSAAKTDRRQAEVEYTPGGSFIKAKRAALHRVQSSVPKKPGYRGVVAGFSRKSRNRLLQKLAQIERAKLPLFVTLTYPGEFAIDPEQWKRDIDAFGKRFARAFPHAGFIWKLEPQKRGAPHFHLLAWDAKLTPAMFYAFLKNWIKTAWYEVVGSGDERHRRAGTGVEIIRSWKGVMHYATKYMSKSIEPVMPDATPTGEPVALGAEPGYLYHFKPLGAAWGNPGRWWGVMGRNNIPYAECLAAWLETGEVNALIRWLGRFRNLQGRDVISRWAVVESPEAWVGNVDRYQAISESVDPLTLPLADRLLARLTPATVDPVLPVADPMPPVEESASTAPVGEPWWVNAPLPAIMGQGGAAAGELAAAAIAKNANKRLKVFA